MSRRILPSIFVLVAAVVAFALPASAAQSTSQRVLEKDESPIIIDTKGTGFKFSDPTKGEYATFDMQGDGTYKKFSWPKAGSGNMWLVLVTTDGVVSNGMQMFGNYSPHSDADVPNYLKPNGFNALNWWDKPQQGGIGHLIIGQKDTVWSGLADGRKLMLWDASSCLKERDTPCVSKPGELHTLESEGIRSISGVWDIASKDTMPKGTPLAVKDGWQQYGSLGGLLDTVGNQYLFYTLLNPDIADMPKDEYGEEKNAKGESCCDDHQKSHVGRWAIDVYLKSVQ